MAVRVLINNLPHPNVRAAVERAVSDGIGASTGDWTVQIQENQNSPAWHVTIWGPNNFRWAREFFGIEEQNSADGYAFITRTIADAVPSPPAVYISYAPPDNKDGFIIQLANGLNAELQVQTGQPVEVLWDAVRMQPGATWSPDVETLLNRAQFLIPVVSPSYFGSDGCRRELDLFLRKEQDRGLVFPVYFVTAGELENPSTFARNFGPLIIRKRKIVDLRQLRFDFTTTAMRRAIAQLAESIREEYEHLLRDKGAARLGEPTRSPEVPEDVYIRSLRLTNFRCFEQLDLHFDRETGLDGRWTCIAGINGAGKSTILQALSLALLGNPLALELGGERLSRMRRRAAAPTRERTSIEVELGAADSREPLRLRLEISDGHIVSKQDASFGPPASLWDRIRPLAIVGYGATRNLSPRLDSSSDHLSADVRHQITLFDPLSQIAGAEVLLGRETANGDFLQLFQNATREVFGAELQVLQTSPPSGILFTNSIADYVEAIDLPDGFRSAAAWLADLCSVWCEKAPSLAASGKPADIQGIVLIDEIDLHLHPSLQRSLVPRLRRTFPRVQWIVTTHSPLVVANFDKNEIIALDRDSEGNIRKLDRQILNFTADEIYQWLMGTSPKGGELEQELIEFENGNGANPEDLAQRMRVSPETDEETARAQVNEFREILKSLKH